MGIIMDDHLIFKSHVEFTHVMLTKYLYILYKILSLVPIKELVEIYELMAYHHFI